MSLGTIVDVRGEAEEDLSDSLGAFLSYFLVRLAADRPMGLTEAVRCIAAATGPIKARRTYLNSMLNMKLAGAVWPHLRETAKPFFMRKTLPMTAGVSNVVIRNGWLNDSGAGDVAEYIRGASTGPILPLVLSPTTLGEEMNVGVSYRTAGFSRQKIAGVMDMFMDQIEHPAGTRPKGNAGRNQIRSPRRLPLQVRGELTGNAGLVAGTFDSAHVQVPMASGIAVSGRKRAV